MKLKNFAIFFALFFIVIGAGCALGWTLFEEQYFPALCVGVLIVAAVPTFKKLLKILLNNE